MTVTGLVSSSFCSLRLCWISLTTRAISLRLPRTPMSGLSSFDIPACRDAHSSNICSANLLASRTCCPETCDTKTRKVSHLAYCARSWAVFFRLGCMLAEMDRLPISAARDWLLLALAVLMPIKAASANHDSNVEIRSILTHSVIAIPPQRQHAQNAEIAQSCLRFQWFLYVFPS